MVQGIGEMGNGYIEPSEIIRMYEAFSQVQDATPLLTATRMVRWAEAVYRRRMEENEKAFLARIRDLERIIDI